MKRVLLSAFIFLYSCHSLAQELYVKPKMSIKGSAMYVTSPSGKKQAILFDRVIRSEDVKMEDLTFNGYLDLKILSEQGATQIFYKVYLYSPSRGTYIFNKKMSDIPCLQVDVENRQLIGACFHVSSCENWAEHYSVNRSGALSLVERNGAYCDPTGQVYSYVDRFRNGKQISSKVTLVHDAPLQSPK